MPLEDIEGRIEEPGAEPVERDLQGPLEEAIQALAPRLRSVFVLHDVQGFKHEEIARTLGLRGRDVEIPAVQGQDQGPRIPAGQEGGLGENDDEMP